MRFENVLSSRVLTSIYLKKSQPISLAYTERASGIHLWLVFLKAFQAMASHANSSLKGTGLGDSDFRVLEVLLHKGSLPVNVIGPKVHLTPGSISIAVDRLVQKNLVTRKPAAERDRRIRIVELTPKGRQKITAVFAHHSTVMNKAAEGLTPEERTQLTELLKKLGKYAAQNV